MIPSTWLGSNNYWFWNHWFDSTRVRTQEVQNGRQALHSFSHPVWPSLNRWCARKSNWHLLQCGPVCQPLHHLGFPVSPCYPLLTVCAAPCLTTADVLALYGGCIPLKCIAASTLFLSIYTWGLRITKLIIGKLRQSFTGTLRFCNYFRLIY